MMAVTQKRNRIALGMAIGLMLGQWAAPLQAAEPGRLEKAKNWLRMHIASEEDLSRYGTQWPAESEIAADSNRVVLITHGYNSKPEDLHCLTGEIRKAGHPCGEFCYPNDQALGASAKLLNDELRTYRKQHPQRRITIVAHSMGGLVARECIENKRLDPGNVDRLIMIGTPNHGTQLARYAVGTDLCEHFGTSAGGNPIRRLRASFADGLSEATDDMTPGSRFLTNLNRRPRSTDVEYSLFLGTGGKVYDRELQAVSRTIRKARNLPWMEDPANRFAAHVAGMEELVAGKGDGAVAVRRGVLVGVSDTVVLDFEHQSVVGLADEPLTREVYDAVLARLAK